MQNRLVRSRGVTRYLVTCALRIETTENPKLSLLYVLILCSHTLALPRPIWTRICSSVIRRFSLIRPSIRAITSGESSCSDVRPSQNISCQSCIYVRDMQCSPYKADVRRWISRILSSIATTKWTTPLCSSLLASIFNAGRTHFTVRSPPEQ